MRGRGSQRASTNAAFGAGSSGPTTGSRLGSVTSSEVGSAASAEGLLYDPSGASLSSLEDIDLMQALALSPLPSGAAVLESDHGPSPTDRALVSDVDAGTSPSISAFSSSDATARPLKQDSDGVSESAVADAVAATIEDILPTTIPHLLDPDPFVSIEEIPAVSALTAPEERLQDGATTLDASVDPGVGDERRLDSADLVREDTAPFQVPEPNVLLLFGAAGLMYRARRIRQRLP